MTTKNFKFEDFSNLDESPAAKYLIHSMKILLELETIQKIKRESISLLNLNPGDIVLEAGCGFANDPLTMADAVGNHGTVIAIDNSKLMLKEARHRAKRKNIQHLLMSADRIQYPDHHFSAVHADRLLVSHKNYADIFKEMHRVTKPGGSISITDVDAKTLVISPTTQTGDIVMRYILASFVNTDMGRRLVNIFSESGFRDIEIRPNLCTIENFFTLQNIFDFKKILQSCIIDKEITENEANVWLQDMISFSQKKQFLYCITFITVCGKKI